MQAKLVPLTAETPIEVPLPEAPLVRVLAQILFPPILSIHRLDSITDFQEMLRSDYPNLRRDEVGNIDIGSGRESNTTEGVIWRFADRQELAVWRVSLGVNFVALETSDYISRTDFLDRFGTILKQVEGIFRPASARRVGLRYIDRLEGEATDRIGDLVQPGILGILQPHEGPSDCLREATAHLMTQARIQAAEGVIHGRWGNLPPGATYDPDILPPTGKPSWVLDLDMFTPTELPFRSDDLRNTMEAFAGRIYSVFRLMVTDEFLRFYGGTP